MRSLRDVESFGGIDADADDLLEDCFRDHEAYAGLLAHKRPIILGRKGSGKTAIFRKLVRTRQWNLLSFGHTFSDYPWHHHRLQELVGVPAEQRYVSSWVYLILLTMAKILLNQDQSQPWDSGALEDLSRLEKFVVDSYGSRNPDVTQVFSPAKKLRIQPTLKVAALGAELEGKLESLPMSDLPRVIQDLNRNITEVVLRCLNPELKYYVCFDELDRGFDPTDEQYAGLLIGLLLAAKQLNDLCVEYGKKFSVAVFLRDDIYQLLRFEDKNKITERLVARIEWDTHRTNWTLQQLMERRFTVTLAETDNETVSWADVFDDQQEMPGRQKKYNHILDRTFRRPRDIIKFCNSVLEEFRERSAGPLEKFTNQDIVAARPAYSDYLLQELDDEIHKHIPRYENYLELLKSLGGLQFDLTEFEAVCTRRHELLEGHDTPISVLRRLFEFSVVAYQQTGGVGGGSQYVWRHLDSRVKFDEAASYFRVHPGFMEAFGLKKFRRGDAQRDYAG